MQSREVRLPDSPPISLDDQDVQIVSFVTVLIFLTDMSLSYYNAIFNLAHNVSHWINCLEKQLLLDRKRFFGMSPYYVVINGFAIAELFVYF